MEYDELLNRLMERAKLTRQAQSELNDQLISADKVLAGLQLSLDSLATSIKEFMPGQQYTTVIVPQSPQQDIAKAKTKDQQKAKAKELYNDIQSNIKKLRMMRKGEDVHDTDDNDTN